MKKESIQQAYRNIRPTEETKQRILASVLEQSGKRPERKRIRIRNALLIAAVIVILTTATVGGFAVYKKWSLPAPKVYEEGNNGIYDVHTKKEYEQEDLQILQQVPENEEPAQEQMPTDAQILENAVAVLQIAGLEDVQTDQMVLTRQTHLVYDREEVDVSFEDPNVRTSVRFDAKDGSLLSLTSIDWQEGGEAVCQTMEQAEALAASYYEKLPVQQGYVMTDCTQYDEQYWSFSFCRQVTQDLYNPYEMVRIGINPKSGRLTGCNVFLFPLLDDHAPGDVPLQQEQAEQIARNCEHLNLQKYELIRAEVEIVLPNWMFTDYMGADLQYAEQSRIAWHLEFENADGEITDLVYLDIDYYTGEILGGDMT